MKAADFEGWRLDDTTRPLLFFIQSLEEMLNHYGHDSYKVPTLNFHYLCIEVLSSIEKMEIDVVDKGNMRPLFEELERMFANDLVATILYGTDFSSLFYCKNDKGEYMRDISALRKKPGEESSIKSIQRTLTYLLDDMSIDDKYLKTLKMQIEEIIYCGNAFDSAKEEALLNLSRLLLTELINRGYSQEYIYACIKERYYSEGSVLDVSAEIKCFWDLFKFENKKYTVILPVKKTDIKKFLQHFNSVRVQDNTEQYFGNSCRWIVEVDVDAYDQEKARENATSLIGLFAALKQYSSHVSKAYYANQAIVIEKDSKKEYLLKKPIRIMSRRRNQSEQQAINRVGELVLTFPVIGDKMINVINLHTSAMESTNESNQLLNLWTIVEVLVEIDKRFNFSKITQISNTFTTVLNASYVKSLVEQMISDLQNCDSEYKNMMTQVTKGENEVEKMVALLVLSEFADIKRDLLARLGKYPLLAYRVEHYSSIFSNRELLKKYLEAHRNRLEWQIMRIYRNRNMIVHDGSHFPYIDLILQNMHYYIDTLIDTINVYVELGYGSLEIIYSNLSHKEYQHLLLLDQKDQNNKPLPIGDDFVEVVLG